MFTQRAALLGFVAFCFYLIAVVNSLPAFYYVLTWLALGLSAASFGLALLSLSGLQTTWNWARTQGHAALSPHFPASEESAPTLEFGFQNNASLGKTGLLLELHFRGEDEQIVPQSRKNARAGAGSSRVHTFLIEAIPAGGAVQVVIPLQFLARGRHRLTEIRLIGSDVLGVFRVSRRLKWEGASTLVWVGPAILEDTSATLAQGAGRALHGTQRAQALGRGDEVRGTRSYIAGDDLRHIHWKSTARTGQLTVREWEHTGRAATLLVWNGVSSSPVASEVGLCLVASLCAALRKAGTPRVLAVLGQENVSLSARDGAGNDARRGLSSGELEALAGARPRQNRPFATSLAGAFPSGEANSYDAIIVVTSPAQSDSENTDDATLNAQIESWLARGAQVTVLWLQDGAAPQRLRRSVRKDTIAPHNERQWEKLQQTGARAFRLEVQDGVSPEKLRDFLLQIG